MIKKSQKSPLWKLEMGATLNPDQTTSFKIWAPFCQQVTLELIQKNKKSRFFSMQKKNGFFSVTVKEAKANDLYYYILDGTRQRPDPVSRFQPEGVHGPSQIISPDSYPWKDRDWQGLPLKELIFYECHIGTFTQTGDFYSTIKKIPYLKKLGITCLEIMPVAQFPGKRNWGYDGVHLYAPQNSYGGPLGLKKLVDACHAQGMAVCLDVVYNHLGPEGNYLNEFGPYFTDKYHTPWGKAIHFGSSFVRQFFIENALYWTTEYHIDVLRLDATHAILDPSPKHILQEIKERIARESKKRGRAVHVIAESNLNDSFLVRSRAQGGLGLDAQWSDDFHHALHVTLTGEQNGYYADFQGLQDLAKALHHGFVFDGKFSPFRHHRYGNSTQGLSGEQFVICSQNHDQIGNRAFGDRLATQISFQAQKLSAALLLLSPYLPLLFMGQEYGETAPFQYFVDHENPALNLAVQKGRAQEFASFGTFHHKHLPKPQSPQTFQRSKLTWPNTPQSKALLQLYQDLIRLRKKYLFFRSKTGKNIKLHYNKKEKWLIIEFLTSSKKYFGLCCNFSEKAIKQPASYKEILSTENKKYNGKRKASAKKQSIEPWSALFSQVS